MKTRQRFARLECEALEDRVTPATLTWTGAVDGLWSHAGNWSTSDVTHPVPQQGDDIVLPAGAANRTQTDDLGEFSPDSITFQDVGYSLSGDKIDLFSNLSVAASAGTSGVDQIANTVEWIGSGPTVSIGANLTLSLTGADTVRDAVGDPEIPGHLMVTGPSSAVFSIAGSLTVGGPSLRVSSSLAVSTTLEVLGTLSIGQNGFLSVEGTSAVLNVAAGGELDNAGLASVGGGQLNVAGRVDVESSAVFYSTGLTQLSSSGSMYIAGAAYIDVAGQLNVGSGGLLLVESGGAVYLSGLLEDSGEVYDAGLMVVELNGNNVGSLYVAQGFLVIAQGGDLYTAGFTQAVGQVYVYGTLQVAFGGDGLFLGGNLWVLGGTVYIYGGVIENGGNLFNYGVVIIESNSAYFDVHVETALYDYGTLYLESGGNLRISGLYVVENGGVFYDFGNFTVDSGATYYDFGQQIGG